jgi:hypothetical protein
LVVATGAMLSVVLGASDDVLASLQAEMLPINKRLSSKGRLLPILMILIILWFSTVIFIG